MIFNFRLIILINSVCFYETIAISLLPCTHPVGGHMQKIPFLCFNSIATFIFSTIARSSSNNNSVRFITIPFLREKAARIVLTVILVDDKQVPFEEISETSNKTDGIEQGLLHPTDYNVPLGSKLVVYPKTPIPMLTE